MSLKYTHRPGGSAHCPECREAISKQANICPHCKSDLKENEDWQQSKETGGCAALIAFSFIGLSAIGYTVNWILA